MTDHVPSFTGNAPNAMAELVEQMYLSRVPAPEPPIFSGDPLQYAAWKSAFEALIDQRRIPANEKIHYLKKYLSGKARECIEGYFLYTSSTTYEEAKAVLDKRFGDEYTLQHAFREKLEKFPKLSKGDSQGLRRYSDLLRQCLAVSRVFPSMTSLNDIRENMRMQEKLPRWLVRQWAKIIATYKKAKGFPSFEVFVDFVSTEADIACDPCVIATTEKGSKDTKVKRQSRQSFTASSTVDTPTPGKARVGQRKVNSSEATREPKRDTKKWPCVLCKGEHKLYNCDDFKQRSVSERRRIAKRKGLCFNCLVPKHMIKECRNEGRCKICKEKHSTLLHIDPAKNRDNTSESTKVKTTEFADKPLPAVSNKAHVHLAVEGGTKTSMILPVYISHKDYPDKEELIYVMLDLQSDITYVLDSVCEHLGATGCETEMTLSTMTSINEKFSTNMVSNLQVRGYTSDVRIDLPPAYVRSAIPANRDHIPTTQTAREWPYLQELVEKSPPLLDIDVGILIGYDCTAALEVLNRIPAQGNGPFAQKSILGWGIVGGPGQQGNVATCHRILTDQGNAIIANRLRGKEIASPDDISNILNQDFTCIEPDDSKQSLEDRQFIETLESGIKRTDSGHFEMPLPFRSSNPIIPDNKEAAIRRLLLLKKRLKRDKQYHSDYTCFMNDIISHGYAEEVPKVSDPPDGKVSYIPHHGVYYPNKPNKIRVVFDCSSKFNGVSLNDLLLQGPDLINGLVGVLCRFRREHIALSCDVEKMFYQFSVKPEHRDFLRFIWWRDGDLSTEPIPYRMTVHLFGAVSSPGCANFGLKKAADLGKDKHGDDAARFVQDDFYVDDGLTSLPTVSDAIHLVQNTKQLCADYGIKLHRFASNSPEVLEAIPPEERAKCLENVALDSNVHNEAVERVLGIEWQIASETFRFQIKIRDR